MRIGLFGTGYVGRALATGWTAAGHDVLLGSREPASRDVPGLRVAGVEETARASDVLVNATPGESSVGFLTAIAPALAGKVLVDVAVDLSFPTDSVGQRVQRALPDTHVVKTLCTMDAAVMVAPGSVAGPSSVFLSGDDADAKRTTAALLTDLGWPASSLLDIGDISTAVAQEQYARLFIGIAEAIGSYTFNIAVVPPAA
ncbi:NADPH-dependent F420 reductase [Streptomyces sp. 4N509B]|uniref:NADPH-dependent F420 reductase n=1 Tax=Streptomyces sp. 4N509B TaxID=3457413 RepID=UPI003FD3E74C